LDSQFFRAGDRTDDGPGCFKKCLWLYVVKSKNNSAALLDRLREARITRSGELLEKLVRLQRDLAARRIAAELVHSAFWRQ
jgi:hypothetical protein